MELDEAAAQTRALQHESCDAFNGRHRRSDNASGAQFRKAIGITDRSETCSVHFTVGGLAEMSDGLGFDRACARVIAQSHNRERAIKIRRYGCDVLMAHDKPAEHPGERPGAVLQIAIDGGL